MSNISCQLTHPEVFFDFKGRYTTLDSWLKRKSNDFRYASFEEVKNANNIPKKEFRIVHDIVINNGDTDSWLVVGFSGFIWESPSSMTKLYRRQAELFFYNNSLYVPFVKLNN